MWVALFEGPDTARTTTSILQVKEAQPSVLEPYLGAPRVDHARAAGGGGPTTHAGADRRLSRVGAGPRTGTQYYVRQLWDAKGRSDLTSMSRRELTHHGSLCACALARAHARTGDPVQIFGYLGRSAVFDEAIATFADRYATVTEQDHAALLDAIAAGRVTART